MGGLPSRSFSVPRRAPRVKAFRCPSHHCRRASPSPVHALLKQYQYRNCYRAILPSLCTGDKNVFGAEVKISTRSASSSTERRCFWCARSPRSARASTPLPPPPAPILDTLTLPPFYFQASSTAAEHLQQAGGAAFFRPAAAAARRGLPRGPWPTAQPQVPPI